jgi:hypothetical protein
MAPTVSLQTEQQMEEATEEATWMCHVTTYLDLPMAEQQKEKATDEAVCVSSRQDRYLQMRCALHGGDVSEKMRLDWLAEYANAPHGHPGQPKGFIIQPDVQFHNATPPTPTQDTTDHTDTVVTEGIVATDRATDGERT